MSEDTAELDDRPLSPATDPNGIAAAGDDGLDREYWGWEHNACVTFCRCPRHQADKSRRAGFCPCCGGRNVNRGIHNTEVEPEPTRLERFGWWLGGMFAAFWQGLTYPWRLDHARLKTLLAETLADGAHVELSVRCPDCGAKGSVTAGE